ncbi:MAG: radical SAM protein [Streptococcaceae bacterium]|nr:radical SAM protein [Streptococcaceae bacterium]
MKNSRFNNIVQRDDNLLIFNSKSKRFVKIPKNIFEKEDKNSKIQDKLIDAGIMMQENVDETMDLSFEYYQYIYDSTLRLTILASEECNFRCSYCYEKFERGNISSEVCEDLIIWLRKNIKNYTAVEISWFGGEPLLGIKQIEYLSTAFREICSQAKRPYHANITTNAYLLSDRMLGILLKNKIKSFTITLDGIEATHDKYRILQNGRGTFERILNNLRNIRDNCKVRDISINIRCNLTKDTLEVVEDYSKLMHNEFYEDRRFSFFFRPAGDWGGERVKEIGSKLIKSLDLFYEGIIKASEKYPMNFSIYGALLMDGRCNSSKKNYYVIGSSGLVYKCTVLFERPENRIGVLTKDGKMLINQEKHTKWIFGNEESWMKSCDNCPFTYSCFDRTCPAKGWILTERGRCGYEKSAMTSILYLLDNQDYFEEVGIQK